MNNKEKGWDNPTPHPCMQPREPLKVHKTKYSLKKIMIYLIVGIIGIILIFLDKSQKHVSVLQLLSLVLITSSLAGLFSTIKAFISQKK